MKKILFCSIFAFVTSATLTLHAQSKNLWITGVFTQDIDHSCNCSNAGGLTYSYNGQQVFVVVCLDQVGGVTNGAWVTLSGTYTNSQCSGGSTLFSVNKIIDTQNGLSGTFNKTNYKCPLSNEGTLTLASGAKWDVASSKTIADGQSIKVGSFAWGVKECEGNLFQTYYIFDYSNGSSAASGSNASAGTTNNSGSRATKTLIGYFDSKQGVMHPLSMFGSNIGYFSEMQKGGETHVVCFDRLANGRDERIGGEPIRIEGYFEIKTKGPVAKGAQTTTNGADSENIFYVTKWSKY
jgi:hypothetical protein